MKKKNTILYVAVLSVFAGSSCLGAIDGALSKIAAAMNVSQTTALYVGSVAALACMFSGLFFGAIAGKRLPYKMCAVLCLILDIAGGTISVFVPSFLLLLVTRCVFGFGVGGLMCIQNPIATKLIPEDRRAAILGVGTCVAFGSQCILQFVGGLLADVRWNLVFLTYLLLIVPLFVVVLFLPKMEYEAPERRKREPVKLPLAAALMCVVLGLVWLNIAPLLFGSAFYVAALSDSATVAAIIAMLFSLGCMTGGLLYPVLYKHLKRYSFSVFLVVAAAGLLISASAGNIVLLGAGFFIGGVGQSYLQAGIMMFLGPVCTPSQLGAASALMTVCLNLGAFLCSSWEALIGVVTGDTLYMPLYIGAVMFLAVAVIMLIRPPAPKEEKPAPLERK